jgi:hypothetical protein
MSWRVAGGMAVIAVPALALVLLLAGPAPHAAWPHSPPEPPLVPAKPIPRWSRTSQASLALLRRVTMSEARRSERELAACEASARRAAPARRPARFRHCALAPMSRTGSFASSNSHMLFALLEGVDSTRACRGGVLALSGTTSTLAMVARVTARGSFDAGWTDMLAASRSIRGLARQSLKLARARALDRECRPRKPAPPLPAGPIA